MATLAREHQARVLATSFGKAEGHVFAELGDRLAFSGNEPPKVSDKLVYFTTVEDGRQTYTLALDEVPAGGVLVHFAGYIHSGSADHFTIRLRKNGKDQEETVRVGSRGVALEQSLAFREMPGPAPRLISILAENGRVQVFINGLALWRHVRKPDCPVTAVSFDFWPLGTASTDAVMLGYEVWALDKRFEGPLVPEQVSRLDALQWHLSRDHTKEVYTIVTGDTSLDLGPIADATIDFMTREAKSPSGYRDWAVRGVEGLLPPADRDRWHRIAPKVVPKPVIEVEDLTVRFHKDFARASHVFGVFKRDAETFSVLQGVNFSAYPGDVIGIIGHNGAGKSTFLRTLAGLIPIDTGRIRVRDNFMLLRGGLGIRPHLTGRENVVSAGIYMGLTPAEARKLIDDILEFSELGEHFDRPTKYYSDGMMSRLVFALATSVSPEILLLDELLGAGDISFQEKAKRRMDSFIRSSRVVVVVTHGVEFVRKSCNKALVLDHGKQLYFGEPTKAVSVYLTQLNMSLGTQETGSRF
jgi:ABC-type polysaccharide/polyol phosphate transport system ATPase subunit